MATRLLYKREDGKWAWHLKADNGQIIATDGSQGYENEADARTMADTSPVAAQFLWRSPQSCPSLASGLGEGEPWSAQRTYGWRW